MIGIETLWTLSYKKAILDIYKLKKGLCPTVFQADTLCYYIVLFYITHRARLIKFSEAAKTITKLSFAYFFLYTRVNKSYMI